MQDIYRFFEELSADLDLNEIMDDLENIYFDGNDITVTTRP